jgi:hypothetical protein
MSLRKQATINPTLTNYAVGLANDLTGKTLSEFLAPTAVVGSSIGQYKEYDEKNQFQILDTARALGGRGKRVEFAATDKFYNCKPQSLEITLDDAELEAAGDADPLHLRESKIRTLVHASVLSHEDKVIKTVTDGLTPVSGVGNWTVDTTDPVKELDDLILEMTVKTSMMPNRLALGIGAWNTIRNHAKIRGRLGTNVTQSVSLPQFASMLLNPAMDIRVGILSKDITKFGKAKSEQNLFGARSLLFYAEQVPSEYDASFAKTFSTRLGGVDSVRTYRDEPHTDVHLVEWSEDIRLTNTACARRIDVS